MDCLYCSNRLIRHIQQREVYWFCRTCWQRVPVMEAEPFDLATRLKTCKAGASATRKPGTPEKILTPEKISADALIRQLQEQNTQNDKNVAVGGTSTAALAQRLRQLVATVPDEVVTTRQYRG